MRRREFDSETVLADVLGVFWRKGYVATSIDDLTQETGIARSGLYGEWKSKKSLFLAAVQVYERQVVDRIIGEVERSDQGLPAIQQAFETVASAATSSDRLGCLICNASSEVAPSDVEIAAVVGAFQERVRRAFRGRLDTARREGELRADADLDALADYLLVAFQGVAHAVRSPMPARAVEHFVTGVLTTVRAA